MSKVTDENDNLVDVEKEEVVFEPKLVPDDMLVVTTAAEAETDIKKAMNKIAEVVDGEPRYDMSKPLSAEAKAMQAAIKASAGGVQVTVPGMEEEKVTSDGSTASYYTLPEGGTQLQDLISFKDMNAQMGEIFRATYRYGQVAHSEKMRDAKKIRFYIDAEIARLEKLEEE